MLPNEILPAIPRQKVRHIPSGAVAEVMDKTGDGTVLCVRFNQNVESWLAQWNTRDCEIVPEEPRAFRVGDKVKCLSTSVFGTIKLVRIAENGWPEQYVVDEFWQTKESMRHATPQEVNDYFN